MVIKLNDLVCYANDNPLSRPINISAPAGSLVVLHGANGAGKSTLMRALAGLITNVTGKIKLNAKVCYIGHEVCLHDNLSVKENLHNLLSLELGIKVKREVVDLALTTMQLAAKKNYYPWQLSKGQKQKLNLAKLLFSKHPIWLLDEPLVHLDVTAQNFLLELMRQHLATEQAVIVVSAHMPIDLPCKQLITITLN